MCMAWEKDPSIDILIQDSCMEFSLFPSVYKHGLTRRVIPSISLFSLLSTTLALALLAFSYPSWHWVWQQPGSVIVGVNVKCWVSRSVICWSIAWSIGLALLVFSVMSLVLITSCIHHCWCHCHQVLGILGQVGAQAPLSWSLVVMLLLSTLLSRDCSLSSSWSAAIIWLSHSSTQASFLLVDWPATSFTLLSCSRCVMSKCSEGIQSNAWL